MAIIYCVIGFVLGLYIIDVDLRYNWISVILMMVEMILIYYLVGLRKLHLIRESNILLFILLHVLISAFVSVNVLWFVESVFHVTVSSSVDLYFTYLLFSGLNFLVINSLVNYSLNVYERKKREADSAVVDQSQQLKKEAELFKLRQQVDPHFLFNSLNSIHALTHIDHERANQMIYSLSQYFRNSIKKQDQHFITLREELDDIRLYLSIEIVRFGHRLHVHEKVDPDVLDAEIPPLILQPLIENAIKYGIYGTSGTVNINIHVMKVVNVNHQPFVQFVISNPFDPATYIKPGTGFGLNGIMRRLYLTYSRNDLIRIEKLNEHGTPVFRVTLTIPMVQPTF